MYLQANVLIPEGFSKESEIEYPLMVFHGHFPKTVGGFRTTPPSAIKNDSIYSSRFNITGYKYIQEKEAFDFYQKWISNDFPRFLVLEIQHQNPYYDDSYAVNSANIGPYGDAITYELIPHIEKIFNGVGKGCNRCYGLYFVLCTGFQARNVHRAAGLYCFIHSVRSRCAYRQGNATGGRINAVDRCLFLGNVVQDNERVGR